MDLRKEIENSRDIKELFNIVKEVVRLKLNQDRAGIDIGFMDLGNEQNTFLGAFYPVNSNIIVVNKTPLRRIGETNPKLMKPYMFTILLHEYIHTLGYYDEDSARKLAHQICKELLGNDHTSTQLCENMQSFMPYLTYPNGFTPLENKMDIIETDDMDYIG